MFEVGWLYVVLLGAVEAEVAAGAVRGLDSVARSGRGAVAASWVWGWGGGKG